MRGVLKKRSQYLPVWRSRFFVLHGVTGELSSAANGETDRQTKAKSTSGNFATAQVEGGSAHHKGRDDSLSSASSASARLGLRSSSLKGSQARLLPCILCYRREEEAHSGAKPRSVTYITKGMRVSSVRQQSGSRGTRSVSSHQQEYTIYSDPFGAIDGLEPPRPSLGGGSATNVDLSANGSAPASLVVLSIGAESEEAVKAWKARIEECIAKAAKMQAQRLRHSTGESMQSPSASKRRLQRSNSLGKSPSSLFTTWKRARDARWVAIDVRNGVRIMSEYDVQNSDDDNDEGDNDQRHLKPSLRVGCMLLPASGCISDDHGCAQLGRLVAAHECS